MCNFFYNKEECEEFSNIYENGLNYELHIEHSNRPIIIFFSSHAVWGGDFNNFHNSIVVKNRFDFNNITKTKFFIKKKYDTIFIRDICKSWYVYGVNSRYNTIDKLVVFLKSICNNRSVITVGSSSGGFAAILFGIKLNADKIFAFDPQVDVKCWLSFYVGTNVYKYLSDDIYNELPDMDELLMHSKSTVYYFYSSRSNIDVCQYKKISELPFFKCFPIKSNDHAGALFSENILDVICSENKKLNKLYANIPKGGYSKLGFLFRSAGVFRAFAIINRKTIREIKKGLRKQE